nr:MAG TPA: hypothetical protein [Caudoviricetes sp.]
MSERVIALPPKWQNCVSRMIRTISRRAGDCINKKTRHDTHR